MWTKHHSKPDTLPLYFWTRTRTNINTNGTEAKWHRSVRACVARESKREESCNSIVCCKSSMCSIFPKIQGEFDQVISSWASFHDTSVSTPGALKHSHCHREVRSHRFEQLKAREALSMFITKNWCAKRSFETDLPGRVCDFDKRAKQTLLIHLFFFEKNI
jgi:hypothetical protein